MSGPRSSAPQALAAVPSIEEPECSAEPRPQPSAVGVGRAGGPPRVLLVPYEARHRDGVLALYAQVFGEGASRAFAARWRWAQESNLFPFETRRWVLVAGAGRVVGFLAALPMPYRLGARDIVAHTPSDFMVEPRHRFHGLRLMREAFATCRHIVSFDDIPATIEVTRYLGARRVAILQRHVRPFDLRAMRALGGAVPSWARAVGGSALRAADSLVDAAGLRARHVIEPARGFDERFDRLFEKLTATASLMTARDSRFLSWRYGPASPHADAAVRVCRDDDGELWGYVVYRLLRGRRGVVYDLQVSPWAPPTVGRALLHHAADALRRRGAWSVRFHRLTAEVGWGDRGALLQGFLPTAMHHQCLVRIDGVGSGFASLEAPVRFAYGDTEASHASL